MEIKVIQNWRGKYNLLSNEETLSFSVGIYGEENKVIEADGVKAILSYQGDREPFDSPLDDMPNVFQECFDWAKSIISTTPYEKQCLLFAKIYQENFEELNEKMTQKKKIRIEKEIEDLQKRLKYLNGLDDISYEVNKSIQKKITVYNKWIESNENELEQVKEGTEKYNKLSKSIEEYREKITFYTNSIVEEISA